MFIIKHIKHLLIVAAVIYAVAIGVVATLGVPLGIDFTGGALTEASYEARPAKEVVEARLGSALDLGEYSLRATDSGAGRAGYILRTRDLSESERQAVAGALTGFGAGGTIDRYASVGPTIGAELADKALFAIGAVALIIVLYVALVFRKVSYPVGSWIFGGITILVLIHDVLVPAALMALFGHFLGAEAGVLFVMALLAVLGYSVNDTIVVFDRVRENLMQHRESHEQLIEEAGVKRTEITYTLTKPFAEIVGMSVGQTLARSINTSVTTLLALLALYFLGGSATADFALVLIAGVIAGTYSSLFIANPLLIAIADWQDKKQRA